MISLTFSNISQLMNYVGFATWFSIGAAVSLSFFNKHLINGRIQTYLECNNPNDFNLTNQWYCHTKVLCVPWLRWKCPDLERPIRVRIGFLGIIEVDFYQTLLCANWSAKTSTNIDQKYHPIRQNYMITQFTRLDFYTIFKCTSIIIIPFFNKIILRLLVEAATVKYVLFCNSRLAPRMY